MVTVHFTSHLQTFADSHEVKVAADDVRTAIDAAVADNPRLRGYILDEQDHLRRHIMVFVSGKVITDRNGLTDQLSQGDEVHVMQALSGG